jgi:hypothetical protein
VLLEIAPDGRAGDLEAIPLGGEHLDELPAPGEQGVEGLGGFIGERLGRRPDPLREEREHLRVDGVGLSQLAGGASEVPHVPRIDLNDRESSGRERGYQGGFVPAGRFHDDQRRGERLAAGDQLPDTMIRGCDSSFYLGVLETGR